MDLREARPAGYTGSYTTVKKAVRAIKGEKRSLAYIRFETEPGFQAQVDWGDFQIVEHDGTTRTVFAFIMVLGYSRAMYVEFVESAPLRPLRIVTSAPSITWAASRGKFSATT